MNAGPRPSSGKATAIFSAEGRAGEIRVRANGHPCRNAGLVEMRGPKPETPAQGFDVPLQALNSGYNLLEVICSKETNIVWAELTFNPQS